MEPNLTIPGHPEISVLGDMMSLNKLPGVAEVAMQSGLYTGRRVRRRAEGATQDKPFRYWDLGSAAYISRGRAVVYLAGPGRRLGRARSDRRVHRLVDMAVRPHRVPDRLPQPRRGDSHLVGGLTRDSRRERAFTVQEIKNFRDGYTYPPAPEAPEAGVSAQPPRARTPYSSRTARGDRGASSASPQTR